MWTHSFPSHFTFFPSQKWHRRRGWKQPIPMNKWRRDPISSWQSFWKRGQFIRQRSPHPWAEQPVLPAPSAFCSPSIRRGSCLERDSLGILPWDIYMDLCVWKKKKKKAGFLAKFLIFLPLPSTFFSIHRKHPALEDSSEKNGVFCSYIVFSSLVCFGFFFRDCFSTEKQN